MGGGSAFARPFEARCGPRGGRDPKPGEAILGCSSAKATEKRWMMERTFAGLGQYRRLSQDEEALPETSEPRIDGAMIRGMA